MKLTAYNPGGLGRDEAVGGFVARQALLARIVEDLRHERPQHRILVGQRGMGKTSLLHRLYFAVLEDAAIANRWVPVEFREEQYNVATLGDLWVNCLEALAEAGRPAGMAPAVPTALDRALERLQATPKAQLEREAWRALEAEMRARTRGLCLLVDNVDLILERLSDDEQWKLREALSNAQLLLIGACVTAHRSTYTYSAAFYDFFRSDALNGLDDVEVRGLLHSLSALRNTPDVVRVMAQDPGRIATLRVLSGGNPRAIVLVHQLLATRAEHTIVDDVTALLDQSTPLYKARFEALSTQSQVIVDAVCKAWDPVTAARVAGDTRLDVNVVSSQLSRLVNDGVLEQVKYPGARKGFQVAERLFNIWYLMRMGGRARRKLLWLVEFLRSFYGQVHVSEYAATLAKSGARDADVLLAYATAAADEFTKRALELQAIEVIVAQSEQPMRALEEMLDLKGADRHLTPLAKRVAMIKDIKRMLAKQPPLDDGTPVADAVLGLVFMPCAARHALAVKLTIPRSAKRFRSELATIARHHGTEVRPLERAIMDGQIESLEEIGLDDLKAQRDVNRDAFEEGLWRLSQYAEDAESLVALTSLLQESTDEVTWWGWLERASEFDGGPLTDRLLQAPPAEFRPPSFWAILALLLGRRYLVTSFSIAERCASATPQDRRPGVDFTAAIERGTPIAEPRISGIFAFVNLGFVSWEEAHPQLAGGDWDRVSIRWLARFATQAGYAQQAADFMDERGLSDTHRPVREALLAAAKGADHLLTVAPEVREPAQKILRWITFVKPPSTAEAPATKPRAVTAKVATRTRKTTAAKSRRGRPRLS